MAFVQGPLMSGTVAVSPHAWVRARRTVLVVGLLLATAFALRAAPALAVDSADGVYGCTQKPDGTLVVDVYRGAETSVAIPASIALEDGTTREVTSVGRYLFDQRTDLAAVQIPGTVTSIGEGAFRSCSALQAIEIPASVTSLGTLAFEGCSALTTVTVGGPITSVPAYAFNQCRNLRSVTLGARITSVGKYAFAGCRMLGRVDLPVGVSSIGVGAFSANTAVRLRQTAAITSLKAGRGRATVRWTKKVTGTVTGFQITYKRSGQGTRYTSAKKDSYRSKTVTKLARKRTYAFRLRPYRTISGKTYYGTWTTFKNVRIK